MSTRFMRRLVWLGTLLAGGTVVLCLNRIFPPNGVAFGISVLYFVSGWVLDSTMQTYEPWERKLFARKYGRWFPFLIGLGGPFFLAWVFFRNLW